MYRPAHQFQILIPAALCTLLLSSGASGQGRVYAEGAAGWSVATIGLGGFKCGDSGTELILSNFSSTSCKGGPNFPGFEGRGEFQSQFTTEATARAFKGSLGGESSVSWFINKKDELANVTFNRTGASGNTTSRWDDRARFTVMGPVARPLTFMDITFRLTGDMKGLPDLVISDPTGNPQWLGTATGTVALGGNTAGSSFFASQVVRMGGINTAMPDIQGLYTMRVGVTGLVSNPFSVLLGTQALVEVNEFWQKVTLAGYMQTLFNHTVTPVSYTLFDDEGLDVTSMYGVEFEQGLEIGVQQSVVPEPGTVLLVGAGLLGTLLLRRKTHRSV
ncbi:MAG: PEP-CTERM sorting domain-containing protein [Gemmatimonas sp.]